MTGWLGVRDIVMAVIFGSIRYLIGLGYCLIYAIVVREMCFLQVSFASHPTLLVSASPPLILLHYVKMTE